MKKKGLAWKSRRLPGKTTVSRFDLYLMRWQHLTCADKQVYVDNAQQALHKEHDVRRQLLQALRAAKKRPAASYAVADQPTFAQSAAVAGHSAGAQMWLPLPMPPADAHDNCRETR